MKREVLLLFFQGFLEWSILEGDEISLVFLQGFGRFLENFLVYNPLVSVLLFCRDAKQQEGPA